MNDLEGFNEQVMPQVTVARHQEEPPRETMRAVPAQPAPLATGTAVEAVDFGDWAGAGTEGLRLEEQLTPFLAILQSNSPQLNPSRPEYIEGARMGALFNTATKAWYPGAEGIECLAVWRDYQYTEWLPRGEGGAGGGFRGIHAPDAPEVRAAIAAAVKAAGPGARFRPVPFRNQDTDEDTVLTEQFNLGVIYGAPDLTEGTARRAMLAFTSTKIAVYKAFITAATDIKYRDPRDGQLKSPALWSHRWRLATVPQKNSKGDFFNYRLALAERGPSHQSLVKITDPLFALGREFYEQWKQGEIRGDYEAGAEESTDSQQGSHNGQQGSRPPF